MAGFRYHPARPFCFLSALLVILLLGTAGAHAQSTEADQLERVWRNTMVVFPQNPTSITGRAAMLPRLLEWYRPVGRLPAVIFMHGCSGLSMGSSQVTRMIRAYASAGFVVFAPNSLDRPRPPYCTGVGEVSGTDHTSLPLRLAELDMVRAKVAAMDWVDQDNLFASGHSLGGWTLSQYSGTAFRALAPFGLHCLATRVLQNKRGIQAPESVPVIVAQGDADEWYPTVNLKVTNCGAHAEMRQPNRVHLLLPGIPHDVTRDPSVMPAVVAFFRQHAGRPIQPLAPAASAPSVRFDGDWTGSLRCAAYGPFQAATHQIVFAIRGGKFRWRTQVAAGTRGFDGMVSEAGHVSALGLIIKTEVLETSDPRANLAEAETSISWPIAVDARIQANRMSGMAVWNNQPCAVEMTHRA
jgi:dienelactone hydrolase